MLFAALCLFVIIWSGLEVSIMITKDEAIANAATELKNHGYDSSNLHFDIAPEETDADSWIIWFEGKGEYVPPGGAGAAKVDKKTGRTRLLFGE